MSREPSADEERLRTAVELHAFGVQVYRQRLRRDHQDWTEHEVEAAVLQWLAASPPQGPPAPAGRWRRLGAQPPGRTA